jgi:hypothetical protein
MKNLQRQLLNFRCWRQSKFVLYASKTFGLPECLLCEVYAVTLWTSGFRHLLGNQLKHKI